MRSLAAGLCLLFLANPAFAQTEEPGQRVTHFLIGSYITASGMDLSTTMHCLGARTCNEVNPALRWMERKPILFGGVKMAATAAAAGLLIKEHKKHPKLVRILAVGMTVGSAYVAYRNTATIKRK